MQTNSPGKMIQWLRSCQHECGEYQRVAQHCHQSREAENPVRGNSYKQLKKEQDTLECYSTGILHMCVVCQSLMTTSKLRDSFLRIIFKKKRYTFFFPADHLYIILKFSPRSAVPVEIYCKNYTLFEEGGVFVSHI